MGRHGIGAALAVVGALALAACGGDDDGAEQGDEEAASGGGSFAIYDWEPNVVAPPGVADPAETGVSEAEAERLAARTEGTIVLREPAPPTGSGAEAQGDGTARYFVLRDRPAVEQADLESATVETDPATGQPSIVLELTPEGQQKYEELTSGIAQRAQSQPPDAPAASGPRHAIVVGGEILSLPVLGPDAAEGIDASRGILITGGFTQARAEEIASSIDPG